MSADDSLQESDMVKMVSSENDALLLTKTTLLCQLTEAEEQRKNATAKICALQRRYRILSDQLILDLQRIRIKMF